MIRKNFLKGSADLWVPSPSFPLEPAWWGAVTTTSYSTSSSPKGRIPHRIKCALPSMTGHVGTALPPAGSSRKLHYLPLPVAKLGAGYYGHTSHSCRLSITLGKGYQCQVEPLQRQLLMGLVEESLKPIKYCHSFLQKKKKKSIMFQEKMVLFHA